MCTVGLFLRFRLSFAPVGNSGVRGTLIALIGQGDEPGGGQFAFDAPDPGGLAEQSLLWVLIEYLPADKQETSSASD